MTTERPSVSLSLTELDRGSWVIFDLPGFTTAASGAPQDSLDALRKASDTSYYKDKDALWVKVVSSGDRRQRRPWWWNQPPGQPVSGTLLFEHEPPAQAGGFLLVCRACSTARRCKSFSQPDGGEVIAKRKGVVVRRGLKEAWSKRTSRCTRTGFEAYAACHHAEHTVGQPG